MQENKITELTVYLKGKKGINLKGELEFTTDYLYVQENENIFHTLKLKEISCIIMDAKKIEVPDKNNLKGYIFILKSGTQLAFNGYCSIDVHIDCFDGKLLLTEKDDLVLINEPIIYKKVSPPIIKKEQSKEERKEEKQQLKLDEKN